MTGVTPSCKEKLTGALESLIETTQDFTDSAYTSHQHRESILMTGDRLKSEMSVLLRTCKVCIKTGLSWIQFCILDIFKLTIGTGDLILIQFLQLQNRRNSNNPSPEMETAILRTLTAAKSLNKQVIHRKKTQPVSFKEPHNISVCKTYLLQVCS